MKAQKNFKKSGKGKGKGKEVSGVEKKTGPFKNKMMTGRKTKFEKGETSGAKKKKRGSKKEMEKNLEEKTEYTEKQLQELARLAKLEKEVKEMEDENATLPLNKIPDAIARRLKAKRQERNRLRRKYPGRKML